MFKESTFASKKKIFEKYNSVQLSREISSRLVSFFKNWISSAFLSKLSEKSDTGDDKKSQGSNDMIRNLKEGPNNKASFDAFRRWVSYQLKAKIIWLQLYSIFWMVL